MAELPYHFLPNEGLEQAPGDSGLPGLGIGFGVPCGPPGLLIGEHGSVAISCLIFSSGIPVA
jgi:hypothetical protein